MELFSCERLTDSDSMQTKWTYYNRDGSQVPFVEMVLVVLENNLRREL